jgi:Superinfection immunity protein
MSRIENAKGPASYIVDGSKAFIEKRVNKRVIVWLLAVPCGIFAFVLLFVKSDLGLGFLGVGLIALFWLFGLGIYFVPTIKAYQEGKSNRQAILLLNIFLGWTVIGWVVALVWAYTNSENNAVPGAGVPAVLCSSCGKYNPGKVPFCPYCGGKLPEFSGTALVSTTVGSS